MSTRIAIVGLGTLGTALQKGLENKGQKSLGFSRADPQNEVGKNADLVFLCMKPHDLEPFLQTHGAQFTKGHTLISFCAGIGVGRIEAFLGHHSQVKVFTVVANTSVAINQGLCAYVSGTRVEPSDKEKLEKVLSLLGLCMEIPESFAAPVMSLTSVGPAFIYRFVEAMVQAGVGLGISAKDAHELFLQVFRGSLQMLDHSGNTPTELWKQVATPGGVTEQGLKVLKTFKLDEAFKEALYVANEKIKSLG